MNENDLRDCFAMFALCGLMSCESNDVVPDKVLAANAYGAADCMLVARKKTPEEGGITTIKKRVRKA